MAGFILFKFVPRAGIGNKGQRKVLFHTKSMNTNFKYNKHSKEAPRPNKGVDYTKFLKERLHFYIC